MRRAATVLRKPFLWQESVTSARKLSTETRAHIIRDLKRLRTRLTFEELEGVWHTDQHTVRTVLQDRFPRFNIIKEECSAKDPEMGLEHILRTSIRDHYNKGKPTIIFLGVRDINIGNPEYEPGHQLILYIDLGILYLCDNNGQNYDHLNDTHNSYGSVKSRIMEALKEIGSGYSLDESNIHTNSKGTYLKKSVCTFAASEMAAHILKQESPVEFLLSLDSMTDAERKTTFPVTNVHTLPKVRGLIAETIENQTGLSL